MREPRRARLWLIFITVALLFHLLLFVYVKFSLLTPPARTSGEPFPGTASPSGGTLYIPVEPPDAILYIPVELDEPTQEETVTQLVEEADAEETFEPVDEVGPSNAGGEPGGASEFGDMFGNASRPLPQGPERELVRIPPRPLQITWPDTRQLKICLGHQIDIRVQVDEDGRILRVDPTPSASPSECVRAALECASQIVFAPGKINGRPAKMWTEIRIDFREKN